MELWLRLLIFNTILGVCFSFCVIVSAFATNSPSHDTDAKYDVLSNDNSGPQTICSTGSLCHCSYGRTVFGTKIICVKCDDSGAGNGCERTCMTDLPECRQCLNMCRDVDGCACVIDCMHRCSLQENPVTRIAVGCGILFLATAALAFFFKVFLMCCLNTVGRSQNRHEDDTASLNSVDQYMAQRLRDAPPRYDALVGPNGPNSPHPHPHPQIGEPRPQNAPSPPDKPPPYKARPSRGELCLQVSTLPASPPPYTLSYLNTPPPPLPLPLPAPVPVAVPAPQTVTPSVTTPTAPPSNPPPLQPLEPGRDLCRTLTL